jgi:hypothetical protein
LLFILQLTCLDGSHIVHLVPGFGIASPQKGDSKMARKPASRAEFVMFDVFYKDGSQRSNRKVPSSVLGGIDLDASALAILEEQDRLIAEKSGNPAMPIKRIRRSGSK